MSQLSIGILLPTKENISDVSMNIIDKVRNGEMEPLELIAQLAAIEKVCEFVRTGIESNVLTELDKSQGKAEILGAKIEKKEVGIRWDYSASEAWKAIKTREEKIVEDRKAIEKIAQNIPDGQQLSYTDTSTGETLSVIRGNKSSKTSFAITLSK